MIPDEITWSQIAWGIGITTAMLIGTAVAGGLVIVFLPATYFTRKRSNWGDQHPVLHWTLLIGKNLLGVVLIVMGVLMLVLPGQGVLTILIGLLLLNFPGKRKFVASLIRRMGALEKLNRFRARFGKPALELGEAK